MTYCGKGSPWILLLRLYLISAFVHFTNLSVFLTVCQHHYDTNVFLPNHPPKVHYRVISRTCNYICVTRLEVAQHSSHYGLFLFMINPFNPLSPHDALMHHFTFLKIQCISLKLRVSEGKYPWNWFTNTWQFSVIFHPHQIIFIYYKSRIATAIRDL